MFSFIDSSFAVEQIIVSLCFILAYLVVRGKALWNMDFEKMGSKWGVAYDIVLSVISAVIWVRWIFIDWQTTLLMSLVMFIFTAVVSYAVMRQRMIQLMHEKVVHWN